MTSTSAEGMQTEALRPSKLAHVVLRVSDLARSRDWYLQVLQATPAYENDMVCFLTYDDEHHRIGLLARPDLSGSSDDRPGLEHVAFTYASLRTLLANYKRLKASGIEPFWTINHGPTISLYYKDPDGNRLELQHDVFTTDEAVNAYFASGAHEENFIGIIFDPEEMIARLEHGEPERALTERPPLPEGVTPWDMHRA